MGSVVPSGGAALRPERHISKALADELCFPLREKRQVSEFSGLACISQWGKVSDKTTSLL